MMKNAAETAFQKALSLEQVGDLAAASAEFARATEIDGSDPRFWIGRGVTLPQPRHFAEASISMRAEIGRREFVRSALMMSALLALRDSRDPFREVSAAASSPRDEISQFFERMQSEVDRIFNYVDSKVSALSNAVMNFGKAVSETIGKIFNSETSKKLFAWGGLALGALALGGITMVVSRRIVSPKFRTPIAVGCLLIALYSYFFAHTSLALPVFITIVGIGTLAASKGKGGT